jgi:hypothetical protein
MKVKIKYKVHAEVTNFKKYLPVQEQSPIQMRKSLKRAINPGEYEKVITAEKLNKILLSFDNWDTCMEGHKKLFSFDCTFNNSTVMISVAPYPIIDYKKDEILKYKDMVEYQISEVNKIAINITHKIIDKIKRSDSSPANLRDITTYVTPINQYNLL